MTTGRGGRAPVVCGVDIGSTNTKVIALDPRGVVLARRRRETPRGAADASVDARQLLGVIEEMILEICADTYAVHAVSVAGVGEDGILVDAAMDPLTPALAWFDPRRADVYAALAEHLPSSDEICTADDAARTLVGWRWAVDQPGTTDARTWLALTDHPASVWAGTPFLSDTLAARTAAWNGRTREWLHHRVTATLGSAALLPRVRRTGDVVGHFVSGRLTAAGVIAPDAVVVAGGHDHPIGGWGVHTMDPGAVLDSMGTAEVVVAQAPAAGIGRRDDLDVAPGICTPGTTVLSVEELARNVEWAGGDPAVGEHLRALIAGHTAPDEYLHHPVFVPGGRGGASPRFTNDAPAAPLSRASAVLGALARLGESALDAVGSCLPAHPPVYAAGGWSRSPGWVRAKQAVSGRGVTVIPEPQVTATAAALLAARAIGWDAEPATAMGITTTDNHAQPTPRAYV
ncbi:MAG TPA: FGGY family carbohydrate kinase [Aldersonia sp.]